MIDDQNAEYAAGLATDLARAENGTTATINSHMSDDGSTPGLQPSLASQIADGRSAVPAADRHEIERQRRRSVATDTLMVAATSCVHKNKGFFPFPFVTPAHRAAGRRKSTYHH